MNKRAVSPLIATVLLIAFAVALGAVVMNWGKTYVEEQAEHAGSKSNAEIKCQVDIDLGVKEIRGVPRLCYNSGVGNASVEVMLENRGTEEISGIRVLMIGTNEEVYSVDLNSSVLEPGGVRKFDQTYDYGTIGDLDLVEFIPRITVEGEILPVMCTKNSLLEDELYDCSTI